MAREFTENQLRILELLGKFKYLTVNQLIDLGIAKHRPTIYRMLREFPRTSRTTFINHRQFEGNPRGGSLPAVHFLTPKGAQFLVDHLDHDPATIRYPKVTNTFFYRDFEHRMGTLDFHIAVDRHLRRSGAEIERFETYFDFAGSNRGSAKKLEALTKIDLEGHGRGYLVPDAACVYRLGSDRKFFLFEMANRTDTKYITGQIYGHARALQSGAPSEKYGVEVANRVLYTFAHFGTMKSVIRRVTEDKRLEPLVEHFLFSRIEDVKRNFRGCWHDLTGRNVEF